MNCPQCGQPYQPEAAFCVECGRPKDSLPVPGTVSFLGRHGRNLGLGALGLVGLWLIGKGVSEWPRGQVSASPGLSGSPTPSSATPPPSTPAPTTSPPATSSPEPPAVPAVTTTALPEETPTPLATAEALPVLYQVQKDLDGDGQMELARVVSLDGKSAPESQARKQLQILSVRGDLRYVSEPFEEPFRTDLDHLAEGPEGKAGLHVLGGGSSGYPKLRLLFAPCSGNFVDFHYNGQQFELAGMGD